MKLSAQERELIESRVFAYLKEQLFDKQHCTQEQEQEFIESIADDELNLMFIDLFRTREQLEELNKKQNKLSGEINSAIKTRFPKYNDYFGNSYYNIDEKYNKFKNVLKHEAGLIHLYDNDQIKKRITEEILLFDTKNKTLVQILEEMKEYALSIFKHNKTKQTK